MYIEYLKSFIYGILFGIPFCLAAGPVFFLLIQAGVNKGVKYALSISYGVVLADTLLVFATYFFVDYIQYFILLHYVTIQIVISILLFIMGLFSILKKVNKTDHSLQTSSKNRLLFFINGFVLNAFNPSNIIVWIGANSKLIMQDRIHHVMFYTAAILTIALLMVMLSLLSKRIQPLLTKKLIKKVNVALGIVYIGFSLALLFGGKHLEGLL